MLTVAILAGTDPEPLAATFEALVPATVAGVVADVLVVCPEPEALRGLCEPMGAALATPDAAHDALGEARGEWLMLIEAGARPVEGWEQAVAAHLRPGARPARFTIEGAEPFWRRLFGRPSRPLLAGFLLAMEGARAALRSAPIGRLPVGRAAVTLSARLRIAPEA